MLFPSVPRVPAVAASVLAAGLMLTVASCSQLTPLGPDAAPSLPSPHPLRAPLVVQIMQLGPPASAASCPAGEVALSGGVNPAACYRRTGTRTTISSAATSAMVTFRPPAPSGQPPQPIQYGFWISLPASDSAALTAVITAETGPLSSASAQRTPVSSVPTTSALTVSVGDRSWALAGFTTADAGRRFEVFLSSSSLAAQLQRALSASG
jgi:hypothetical protein